MRMRASLCQNKWAPLVPAELRAMASGFLSFFRLLLSTPSPSSQNEMLQLLLQIRAWMLQLNAQLPQATQPAVHGAPAWHRLTAPQPGSPRDARAPARHGRSAGARLARRWQERSLDPAARGRNLGAAAMPRPPAQTKARVRGARADRAGSAARGQAVQHSAVQHSAAPAPAVWVDEQRVRGAWYREGGGGFAVPAAGLNHLPSSSPCTISGLSFSPASAPSRSPRGS
jgi:hypothetical protein